MTKRQMNNLSVFVSRFTVGIVLHTLLASGAAWAQAQAPLVAVLLHGTESSNRERLEGFRDGMRELGYVKGKNLRLEVRWSDNNMDRLAPLAAEILKLKPAVIVAAPVVTAQALHRESKTVPIVMASG